jgi:hypothetical protein
MNVYPICAVSKCFDVLDRTFLRRCRDASGQDGGLDETLGVLGLVVQIRRFLNHLGEVLKTRHADFGRTVSMIRCRSYRLASEETRFHDAFRVGDGDNAHARNR